MLLVYFYTRWKYFLSPSWYKSVFTIAPKFITLARVKISTPKSSLKSYLSVWTYFIYFDRILDKTVKWYRKYKFGYRFNILPILSLKLLIENELAIKMSKYFWSLNDLNGFEL